MGTISRESQRNGVNCGLKRKEVMVEGGVITSPVEHHLCCMAWETVDHDDVVTARVDGWVSRHLATDELTVFGHVWTVLEGALEPTAKKTLSLFLSFWNCSIVNTISTMAMIQLLT